MRKLLLAASLLLLTLSAVLGFLNSSKMNSLRAEKEGAIAARAIAENARIAQGKELRSRTSKVQENTKSSQTEARIAQAEADVVKTQSEKNALEEKLRANESTITQLQKRLEESAPKSSTADAGDVGSPSAVELQAQLDETRKQLEDAEHEKTMLAERVHDNDAPATRVPEERVARRRTASPMGLHGRVMAVNPAYNFVVLNLGEHQGVEANSEMLVMRGGTLIGKIRVSSVEPATAIGDIISSTLARGVQVQPGDIVIYAGSNS